MTIARTLKRLPGVQGIRRRRYLQFFVSASTDATGSHYGAYETFAEARSVIPNAPAYDRAEFADEYTDRASRIHSYDESVIDCLNMARPANVFDFGGSTGVHFSAYLDQLRFSLNRWMVCELPSLVAAIAERNGITSRCQCDTVTSPKMHPLSFTSDAGLLHEFDCLLALGSLHYAESMGPLGAYLRGHKPRHVILSKLPLHEGPTFVTLQNVGRGSIVPHWVWSRSEFLRDIARAGYVVRRTWDVPERRFRIFDDEIEPFAYSGLWASRI